HTDVKRTAQLARENVHPVSLLHSASASSRMMTATQKTYPKKRKSRMPDTIAELRQDLATANRVLANEGVLDAFGHISVRHPDHPDRYLISRYGAAEVMQAEDILELTLDS